MLEASGKYLLVVFYLNERYKNYLAAVLGFEKHTLFELSPELLLYREASAPEFGPENADSSLSVSSYTQNIINTLRNIRINRKIPLNKIIVKISTFLLDLYALENSVLVLVDLYLSKIPALIST